MRTAVAVLLSAGVLASCTTTPIDQGDMAAARDSSVRESDLTAEELSSTRASAHEHATHGDFSQAHALMVAVTAHRDAVALDWMYRASLAMDLDQPADAALALTTVATRWPIEARGVDWGRFIVQTAYRIRKHESHRPAYLALLEALYAGGFHLEYGLQPDGLWQDLIVDSLQRDDLGRAKEILSRIESTGAILAMGVDRRFDALVKADPERFDVLSASRNASASSAAVMAEHPRKLGAFVQHAYDLFDEGRHREVLAMCDRILSEIDRAGAEAPPFDDLVDSLNWVYNHKAAALRGMGRWDDALAVMEAGQTKAEFGGDNVSQTINLGTHYIDAGRFEQALAAVADLGCTDAVSPYGCMQLHHVLYVANRRLGRMAQADEALAYLRENRAEAEDTWVAAALESGDLDLAAARLIEQLEDPYERGSALADVQDYLLLPMTPVMQERHDRRMQLLARADVSAAIDRVGRRVSVPIYKTPD